MKSADLLGGPVHPLVVHVEQLTPAVMTQLAEQGFRAVRDPDLVIFIRRLPPDEPKDDATGAQMG